MKNSQRLTGGPLQKMTIYALLSVCSMTMLAQSKHPELDSGELLRRIVDVNSSSEFKRGSAESRNMSESYLQELVNRSEARQPSAMFYYGWYRYQIIKVTKDQATKGMSIDLSTAPLCVQTFRDFKAVAENPKIKILYIATEAMSLLGEMYRDGIGTPPSRYLAADWFVQSSKQRYSNGDREGAIRALENALNVVPDHPAALEFRVTLLKQLDSSK